MAPTHHWKGDNNKGPPWAAASEEDWRLSKIKRRKKEGSLNYHLGRQGPERRGGDGGREVGHHPEQPDPHQHQGGRSHSPHAICHQGVGATRGTETTEVVWQWWKEGERREWEGRPHRLPRRNPFFSNQQQEGEVNFLSKSESSLSLSIFCL